MRTSKTDPLEIANIVAPTAGVIGVTFCPGKHQMVAATGCWARDLGMDLDVVSAWGAGAVLTLVTLAELRSLRVEMLGQEVIARGIRWFHLPIEDAAVPTQQWERDWTLASPELHRILDSEGRVLVHCKGGLGRAGVVAARLLFERGVSPDNAITRVRRMRPRAIETRAQEDYLRALGRPEATRVWNANA
jgi:protein-tyrosine phosphatase